MSLIGSITNTLSSLNMPAGVQSALSVISKEGPAAVLPIEGAVIAGRSAEASKRSGFLELQERLPEEVAVAIVWLFGVNFLRKKFNTFKDKLFPNHKHLNLDIAYKNKTARKFKTVGTTAQEGYLKNALEGKVWNRLKGGQLAFSVGLAMALCAIAIPWLNKKKTDWYIENVHKPKHRAKMAQKNASQNSQTQPITQTPSTTAAAVPPVLAQTQALPLQNTVMGSPFQTAPQLFPGGVPMALSSQGQAAAAPKFGGIGSIIQNAGHLIEQTPYGSILVVDTGITGGRAVSYGKRSPFESIEVVVRDGISLYLYILAVPHLMALAAKGIDPLLKTTMLFRPGAAEAVNNAILKGIAQSAGTGSGAEISANAMRTLINGSSHDALGLADGWLESAMRTAPATTKGSRTGFIDLLRTEAYNYASTRDEGIKNFGRVQDYLSARMGDNYLKRITVDDIDDVLSAIKNKQGIFAEITDKRTRADLITAVKQAFQHTAGIDINMANIEKSLLADKNSPFAKILKALPKTEREALLARVQKMATLDAQETANRMLRRQLVLARNIAGDNPALKTLLESGEGVATWLEQAANNRVPLKEMVDTELKALGKKLGKLSGKPQEVEKLIAAHNWEALEVLAKSHKESFLTRASRSLHLVSEPAPATQLESLRKYFAAVGKDSAAPVETLLGKLDDLLKTTSAPAHTQEALAHYRSEITKLLSGKEGRITSLHISDAVELLSGKVQELMRGGLKHDDVLFKQTLAATNELVEDSRLYSNPKKLDQARTLYQKYLKRLLSTTEQEAGKTGGKLGRSVLEKLMTAQSKLNQNVHMLSRVAALGVAMAAIGWGVPKIQYAITKKLTGKNEHPTFAALNKEGEAEEELVPQFNPSLFNGPPLNRNNAFSLFQQR